MAGACLTPLIALALALAAPPDADAPTLAARLGSDTPAEREDAAQALEALGLAALPALVDAARGATDPDVRARALGVWDAIQREALRQPTLVRVDFQGLPLPDAIKALGERSGFALGMINQGRPEPVNVREPGPIPFWKAAERLGFSGGYYHQELPAVRHFPTLQFNPYDRVSPHTLAGPFLVQLLGLHEERHRNLTRGPWLRVDEMDQRIPVPRGGAESVTRFYADFRLLAEPRMWFTQEGPARAVEAADDLGQSLVPPPGLRDPAAPTLFRSGGGVSDVISQVDLAQPPRRGRAVTRLRVAVPLALQINRPLPALDIPLAESRGQTFAHDGAHITVSAFEPGPNATTVALDLRLDLDKIELPASRAPEVINSRMNYFIKHQFEFVDASGESLTMAGGGSWGPDGRGRMRYSESRRMSKTGPARLLYYPVLRVPHELKFEFTDIPIP